MTDDIRRRAVALRYDRDKDAAPVVIAQGAGYRADRIRELAEANGVVIREDPALVEALSALHEQRPIPSSLYGAVAQLLAVVYRLDAELASRRPIPDPGEP